MNGCTHDTWGIDFNSYLQHFIWSYASKQNSTSVFTLSINFFLFIGGCSRFTFPSPLLHKSTSSWHLSRFDRRSVLICRRRTTPRSNLSAVYFRTFHFTHWRANMCFTLSGHFGNCTVVLLENERHFKIKIWTTSDVFVPVKLAKMSSRSKYVPCFGVSVRGSSKKRK